MINTAQHRIRSIVATDRMGQEFYSEFLIAFADFAKAELALAWNCEVEPISPICQALRDPNAMVQLPLSSQQHQSVLLEAFRKATPALIAPSSPDGVAAPILLVAPLKRGATTALVEFILPPTHSVETNQGLLSTLTECCRIAESAGAVAGAELQLASPAMYDRSGPLTSSELDTFTLLIHRSLDMPQTARHVVNETRRLLDCDRVTLLHKRGRGFRTEAISGQPSVNHRSNTVKGLQRLADKVLSTRRAFWFPSEEAIPPQIEQPLHEYLNLSMTRSLAIIPIYDVPTKEDPESVGSRLRPCVIAGLIIEQADHQWVRAQIEPSIELVSRQASTAIRNAHDVSQIFLYPVWRALGNSRGVAAARNFPKLLLGLGGAAALIAAMMLVPAEFRLGCEGKVMPIERQRIFADQSGRVSAVHVEHGDDVTAGELVLELKNEELAIQFEQTSGELAALRERLQGSRSIRVSQGPSDAKGDEAKFNHQEIQAQINSLEKRLHTIQAKKQGLRVTTPLSGQILTWDVTDQLQDRPVEQGDLLLEVANTNGEWQLELDLPDRKIGHLMRAVIDGGAPLAVRFTMASEPQKQFFGTVREVDHATIINEERLHVVRVKVDVDEAELSGLQHVGSTVSAKIVCGHRKLGFVWFHDVWEFIQYRLLFHVR